MSITTQGLMQIIIDDFCKQEYGSEADFSNNTKIPLAYTTSGDGQTEIQVTADIENLRIQYFWNGHIYGEELFKTDEQMIDFLQGMTFDSLVSY